MPEDYSRPKPSLDQLRELAKALEQFVWHDERSSYPMPWAQERHRLPGFVRVADAVRPLRDISETSQWPGWLLDFIRQLITTFDVLAYSWGWGQLLRPADARAAYIARCEARFRASYLVPIQEAAKECRKNFSAIDCAPFLEELCENVPSIDFDLIRFTNDLGRIEPLWQAVCRKRDAFLFGESYPILSGADGNPEDFATDIVLGDTLKFAHTKVAHLVAKAEANFRHISDAIDPKAARLVAACSGNELPCVASAERGRQPVPTEWMVTVTGEPMGVDIRECQIWGDGKQEDLLKTPDGRFALARWDSRDRRYAVNPATQFRLREATRRDVIAWCNAGGYIYPEGLMPAPDDTPQALPHPGPIASKQDVDLAPYALQGQPWYGPLPAIADASAEILLALAPGIDIVLFTATDIELEAALRRLEPCAGKTTILKSFAEQETYYLGTFGAFPVAVTKCRMGSVGSGSAQLATDHAIRVWAARAIIMTGIAFGKDPSKQQMADVLVSSELVSYEPQRVGQTETIARGMTMPANQTLLNRFENVPHWSFLRPDGSRCDRHVGTILSGEKLVDNRAFKRSLFEQHPAAIGGEMEGAGLAAAAHRQEVPWIVAKAICDWGDGTKHSRHQPLAAAAAVSLVHHVLSQADVLHGLGNKDR